MENRSILEVQNPYKYFPIQRGVREVLARKARRRRTILQGEIPNPIDIPPGCRFHPRCPDAIPDCQVTDLQLLPVVEGHEVACIRV